MYTPVNLSFTRAGLSKLFRYNLVMPFCAYIDFYGIQYIRQCVCVYVFFFIFYFFFFFFLISFCGRRKGGPLNRKVWSTPMFLRICLCKRWKISTPARCFIPNLSHCKRGYSPYTPPEEFCPKMCLRRFLFAREI